MLFRLAFGLGPNLFWVISVMGLIKCYGLDS